MKLGGKELRKRATDLELKEQKKFHNNLDAMSVLEALLLDVYATLRPKPRDYELRKRLVQVFNITVKDIFGSSNGYPITEAFGSFTMDLFTDTSDLDLSLNFSDEKAFKFPRERKISVLMKFADALYSFQRKRHVSGVFPIMRARVPIVKVVDCGTGIECDISVENKDGISRSSIFAIVSSIDERFRILSYLIKFWAKVHDINSAKDHTLNSLTIISLVAFHLQTRDPPILPPFSTLFKDGTDIAKVQNVAFGLKSFGQRNKESVAGLFVSLLNKLSAVESLWRHGLCASVYEGTWISKTWKSGVGNMSVEDYLDRSENFARAVRKNEMHKIYAYIRGTLDNLSAFMNGRYNASMLKKCLFEFIPLHKPLNQLTNGEKELKRKYPFHGSAIPLSEDTFIKRRRFVEVGEGRQFVEAGGKHAGLYEPLRNTSFPHLPIPQQMPAASSQYIQRMHPLEPPVTLSQRASQTGYHAEHHSHHPFTQLSYQSGNLSIPLVLSLLQYYESTNNRHDHRLTLHGPWDSRPTIPLPGYSNQDIRHPPY